MKKILFIFVFILIPTLVKACDFIVGDIAYNITSVAHRTVEVTYFGVYKMEQDYAWDEEKANYGKYNGIVKIPEEVSFEGVTYKVTSIGNLAFVYTTNLENIIFPSTIESIGSSVFINSNIEHITIPESVTELKDNCFLYAKALKEVDLSTKLTKLPECAFEYSGIEKITIPDNIHLIEFACFMGCENLREIQINDYVKMGTFNKRGSLTFHDCNNIEKIVSLSENPWSFHNNTFDTSIYLYAKLIVPESTAEKYRNTEGWNNFVNIEESPNLIKKYKLVYYVDEKEYKTYELKSGSLIYPEPAPTMEGYTFSGWSEIPETMPAHDVTVIGTFTINKYKLIYNVDGEEYKSYELDYGASITPEVAPTKEGYTFSGWSEIPATMPAHDVTVIGTFTINKYKLIYNVDGEEYKSYELEYGASITPEAEPTKEGYTFSGWSEIPETMPAHDVTLTGTFTINKYKLTYIVDDAEYKVYEIEYGAKITPEAEPTKEGYTFYGWSEIPETMPAHDVTITGTFNINKYKLTYTVDGEEYKSYDVEYGATITPEPAPTKEGYTFSGWSDVPETMPAHDVTVTGTFSINSYKLTYMIENQVYKETMYEYGAIITPEPQPEGDYATFEWIELPEKMPAHDVVVYASYTSGIAELLMTKQQDVRIFSPNGKRLNAPQRGINILRMSDGRTKKIVVK
jgi:Listeria/Bacterioides repeat